MCKAVVQVTVTDCGAGGGGGGGAVCPYPCVHVQGAPRPVLWWATPHSKGQHAAAEDADVLGVLLMLRRNHTSQPTHR